MGTLKEYVKKIDSFYMDRRRMPSYSEMLGLFGLNSKNAVYKRITRLVKAGLIGKDRTGRLIPFSIYRPVPLLGSIQAGFPSPAEEELQDVMSLDSYLIKNPQATFLVKVEGDSMIDAGIRPGDLVLVQKNLTPGTGDIVIARIDNEWTLKYFEQRGKSVLLRAGNRKYPAIFPKEELHIAGVVIANVRKYK